MPVIFAAENFTPCDDPRPTLTSENTTLSTWNGSTNITTLGDVSNGTWNASTISVDKGGTGQTTYTDGQLLIGNTTNNSLAKATLTQGDNITITNGNGSITIASQDTTYSVQDGELSQNNFTNALKSKLDGIAANAEVNVQSDWNETDTTADAYIQNKPTIPSGNQIIDWTSSNVGTIDVTNLPVYPTSLALRSLELPSPASSKPETIKV